MYENQIKKIEIPQNNSFHFIRLVCSLIVIYEHTLVLSNLNFFTLNIRQIAVNVFFLLSGFWVFNSLLSSISIREFFIKRVKKIYPQYFIVIVFFALVLCFYSSFSKSEYFKSRLFWKYLLVNLLTLNFIQPNLPGVFENLSQNGAVNGSLWTIKIEIGFYIILPFITYIITKLKRIKFQNIFLLCIYILSVIYEPICIRVGVSSSLANQLPAYLCYFSCGIFVYLNWYLFQKYLNKIILPSLFLFSVSVYFKISYFIPICICIIVFWIAFYLPFLGKLVSKDYSYGSYLIHFPIIQILNTTDIFEKSPIFALLIIIEMSFFTSILLTNIQKK